MNLLLSLSIKSHSSLLDNGKNNGRGRVEAFTGYDFHPPYIPSAVNSGILKLPDFRFLAIFYYSLVLKNPWNARCY